MERYRLVAVVWNATRPKYSVEVPITFNVKPGRGDPSAMLALTEAIERILCDIMAKQEEFNMIIHLRRE